MRDSINISMSEYPFLHKEKIVELGRRYNKEIDDSLSKSDMIKQLEEHVGSLTKEEQDNLSIIGS